ncbi:MAG: hypothetical protein M3296_05825 [Actinomycetota bacterium]|nr:hypothetical protein [Actinomycetota bacterium]
MTTLPLAHAGHWIASVLYVVPVLVVVGALGVQVVRDKRREEREGPGATDPDRPRADAPRDPPAAPDPPAA